ncbi:carboxymuconolactone decarboxylase family protein [Pseudonocardia parietis]|uniref:Carboxymuconolactone decarboxylase-like domain-containing protein n=1 Tax=Pseudonocardia parietis TaxID=570936 RepID=A0ABS4VU77_9PSEU|nr:carboxymuconolactone decarboxylase family protein [Pseudonocardia parietis]MBP2367471.1 hypothetical protein [Pseudonocardia parietis]
MSDDAGVPLSIFQTMARHPKMMKRFNVLGGFFLTRGELPARERELCILRTAWRTGSDYEWAQHVLIGRDAGLTDTGIEQVVLGGDWSEPDTALLRLTDEVLDHTDVSDATWSELSSGLVRCVFATETLALRALHRRPTVRTVLLVGFYRMTAGFLNAAGVVKEYTLPSWPNGANDGA